MDQTYLLLLALVVLIAIASASLIRSRARRPTTDTSFAVSTEGMKVCPKCGMGNLWTERRCITCGNALQG